MRWTRWKATGSVVVLTCFAVGVTVAAATPSASQRESIGADPSLAHRHLVVVPAGDDTAPRDLVTRTPSRTTARLDVDRSMAPDYKPVTTVAASLDRDDPWSVQEASNAPHARVQLDRANPWTGRPFD